MNKQILIVAASALMLTACKPAPTKLDPTKPQVSITNGKIGVDQETIEFAPDQKDVTVTWQLPKGNFTFPQDGIAFERSAAEEIVKCQPQKDNVEFTCLNRHTKPGRYKYTIKVLDAQKPLEPYDPFFVNR
jgi:hypothetical protein